MAGNDERVVVQCQELPVNRSENIRRRSAPEIGPSDAVSKQRVPGEEDISPIREQEASASRSVAGGMNHAEFKAVTRNRAAVIEETINAALFGGGHPQPLGLCVQSFKQEEVCLMDGRWGSGFLLKFEDGAHVIDVCMGAHDLLQSQAMRVQF